jgi:hypothetical protein
MLPLLSARGKRVRGEKEEEEDASEKWGSNFGAFQVTTSRGGGELRSLLHFHVATTVTKTNIKEPNFSQN